MYIKWDMWLYLQPGHHLVALGCPMQSHTQRN